MCCLALLSAIISIKRQRGLKARQYRSGALPLAEHPFFATVFTLAGCLAKADGRISEEEIAGAERLMAELGLNGVARSEAIALFKRGAAPDFQLEAQLSGFSAARQSSSRCCAVRCSNIWSLRAGRWRDAPG